MSSPIALVVEENPITRQMIRVTLESAGLLVLEARGVAEARAHAGSRRPDVVVADHVLPDGSGLELLAELRASLDDPELPAVIVTGTTAPREDEIGAAGDATQILAKPVDPARLLEVVRDFVSPVSLHAAGPEILIVSGDSFYQRIAARSLSRGGYRVDTAVSAHEALGKARAHPPDALVADLFMPVMDGFDLCRRTRGEPTLWDVPVVLVSSATIEPDDRELARLVGASTVALRTPEFEDVLRGVAEALATPPPAGVLDSELVAGLHRKRVEAQLARVTAQNIAQLWHAAIQSSALTLMRGLAEMFAEPHDVVSLIGQFLIQLLDTAGLSTGILYVLRPGSPPVLRADLGLPLEVRSLAISCFGHAALLERIVETGKPVAFSGAATEANADGRDLARRIGHRSVLVIPFVADQEGLGAVVMSSDAQLLSGPEWIAFAENVAGEFRETAALGRRRADQEREQLQSEVSVGRVRLEELSRRLVRLQEEERRTIARELHDEVGQILTGLKLLIETSDRSGAALNLAELRDMVSQLLSRVQDLSLDLRPPMLDDLGLVPTLLWHFGRYRAQTGIEVQFRQRSAAVRFAPEIEIAAFRIIQEALTNVARHAGVRETAVDLWVEDETLGLHVEDRGRGFDQAGPGGPGTGLAGMRERASLAGGILAIRSRPGGGTRLTATLPIAPKPES